MYIKWNTDSRDNKLHMLSLVASLWFASSRGGHGDASGRVQLLSTKCGRRIRSDQAILGQLPPSDDEVICNSCQRFTKEQRDGGH